MSTIADIAEERRKRQAMTDLDQDPGLKSGGGGGTFDGMEPRLARLEAHMDHAQADLSVLKTDMGAVKERLARLEEKVAHLPSKGFIVTSLMAMLAVIAALITYQEQIRSVLG